MKKFTLKSSLILFSLMISSISNAQSIKKEMEHINEIFKKSVFKTQWFIDDDGYLTRIDKSENTYTFNLMHVQSITYKYDGNHNLLFQMKEGHIVQAKLNYGMVKKYPFNIVGFKKRKDYDSAYKHFIILDSLFKKKLDSIQNAEDTIK